MKTAVLNVIPRWKDVGGALGVRENQIQIIAVTHSHSPEDCMRGVVSKWLKRSHNEEKFGPPTWKNLVKAIANPSGGQDCASALELAKKHLGTLLCDFIIVSLVSLLRSTS